MPRVLRIINRLNLGGPTYNAALLTKYLAPEFETLLVAGTKTDTEESSEFIVKDLGVDYITIPEMSREIDFRKDRIAYKKIKDLIRDFKPDIVHTHSAKAGTLGRLAAASLKVPVIVHTFHGHVFHSYFNSFKTKIFLQIERYLAKKSTAIIALSEIQKHDLGTVFKICPPDKITVIPLGFDLSKFRENMDEKRKGFRSKYNVEDDEIAIGIIGRLVPIKNHTLFLQAFNEVLRKSTKKVRGFIIGDGEERSNLEKMADQLGISWQAGAGSLQTTLTFTSWIKNIDWALAGLDIVAMTSLNEGTPVSLIEAQASGKSIVSTSVGGIENIVKAGETALLSQSNDEKEFALNLLKMVEDEDLRIFMAKNGWENVSRRFHFTRLTDDVRALYNRLLKTKH